MRGTILAIIFFCSCTAIKHVPVVVYDTTHKPYVVYDTTRKQVTVTVYDTTHKPVMVYDTTHKHYTQWDTTYETVELYDTSHEVIYINDTIIVNVPIPVYDTMHVPVTIRDTTYDTTKIAVTLRDTTRISVTMRDTTRIPVTLRDTTKTKFGILINGFATPKAAIPVARSLKINWVRDGIVLDVFDTKGMDAGHRIWVDSGFHTVTNLLEKNQGTQRMFPTDLSEYRRKLVKVLDKYKFEIVVIENEEMNLQEKYYYGPITAYIEELKVAIEECHKRGIKVADGGVFDVMICFDYAKDLKARGKTDSLAVWRQLTFSGAMNGAFDNPNSTSGAVQNFLYQYRRHDTLMNAFKSMNLDYVNIHYYEPLSPINDTNYAAPNVFMGIVKYINKRTGKKAITNEVGTHNKSPQLVSSMCLSLLLSGIDYAIWYSGDTDPAVALYEHDGSLRTNGIAFRNFIVNLIQ